MKQIYKKKKETPNGVASYATFQQVGNPGKMHPPPVIYAINLLAGNESSQKLILQSIATRFQKSHSRWDQNLI